VVCAQVVFGGGIQADQSLLPKLHRSNPGEGLGDGGDPKDRVLGNRCVRRDVRHTVAVEGLKRSVGHQPESQTDSRSAVENLVDPGPHLQLIDSKCSLLVTHAGSEFGGRRLPAA